MRQVRQLLEIVLLLGSAAYLTMVTAKWVKAEKQVSYLEGRWSVYQEMAEKPPLEKW